MFTSGYNSRRQAAVFLKLFVFKENFRIFATFFFGYVYLKFIPAYEQPDCTGVSTKPFMTIITTEKLVFWLRTVMFYC